MPPTFNRERCLITAHRTFAAAPALPHIERTDGIGELVAVFVLPLNMLKPQNRTSHRAPWAYKADRKRVAEFMRLQSPRFAAPLPGRPMVLCTRFSSREPDAYNDGFKMAIDVLTLPSPKAPQRLGIIVDDRPTAALVRQWWEPGKHGSGFGLVRVFTGEA